MANTTLPKAHGRIKLVDIHEVVELKLFKCQPDLFWNENPEFAFDETDAQAQERNKQDLLALAVQKVITRLPEIQQKIIYLRYFDDGADAYSAKEIAKKLGIPRSSYYNYLNQAKEVLRLYLENQLIVMDYLKQLHEDKFLGSDYR